MGMPPLPVALVYASGAGKVAFLLRDLHDRSVQGAMLYDLETEDYAIVEGSREDAYFYLGNGSRAVVVQNPVEAMSKWVLEQLEAAGHYLAVLPSQSWPKVIGERLMRKTLKGKFNIL